ncbi:hypothetical protein P5V15_007476 [Pogonomyrmex californicus]
MDNYLSSTLRRSSIRSQLRRFYLKLPRLSSPSRSLLRGYIILRGRRRRAEGYHRVLYHISYYKTAYYNSCCRGFYRFFALFSVCGKPTMTDTCVFAFYHARSRGVTRVSRRRASVFFSVMYISPVPVADRVSQKSGVRIRSAIHDLRVSSENSAERDWVHLSFFFFFFFIFLSACEDLCRRACVRNVSQRSSYRLDSELLISSSFSAASVFRTVCNSGCVILLQTTLTTTTRTTTTTTTTTRTMTKTTKTAATTATKTAATRQTAAMTTKTTSRFFADISSESRTSTYGLRERGCDHRLQTVANPTNPATPTLP